MSRSKRALPAPAVEPRRGQGFHGLFLREGRLRGGWMLAASLLAWLVVSLGVRLGLRVGFDALFRAWNLTAENVYRAPAWARMLYVWHGSLISLFDALAVLALSHFLRRAWLEPNLKPRAMRTSPLQTPPAGNAVNLEVEAQSLPLRGRWPEGPEGVRAPRRTPSVSLRLTAPSYSLRHGSAVPHPSKREAKREPFGQPLKAKVDDSAPVVAMSSSPERGNVAGYTIQLKPALIAWLVGAGFALLSAALFLLTDSLRLDWPLTRPHFSAGLPALAVIALAGTLAEEAFTKTVVYDGVRGRWGRAWAIMCAIVTSFAIGSGWAGRPVGAANALLLGGLCCMVYANYDLWPSALLRWGFGFANMFLLGFGGGDSAVYRLYGVSEQWLTGGDAGLACGLWMTAFLIAPIAAALFSRVRKRGSV